MQRMQIWVGLSVIIMHLCLANGYYSASLSYSAWTWLPYSYGYELGLECLLAVPGIAEPALVARDTALTIMTTSLEMLQIKPFGSKRYPSDLIRHLYIYSLNSWNKLYLVETCRRNFIIQAHAHWIS